VALGEDDIDSALAGPCGMKGIQFVHRLDTFEHNAADMFPMATQVHLCRQGTVRTARQAAAIPG
jgi:hypothetical protein